MAVNHRCSVTSGGARNGRSQHRMKTGPATESVHPHPFPLELLAPRADPIKAAHRHFDFRCRSSYQFDDEAFGAAGCKAQENLKHFG